jgi:hypothetical protein
MRHRAAKISSKLRVQTVYMTLFVYGWEETLQPQIGYFSHPLYISNWRVCNTL